MWCLDTQRSCEGDQIPLHRNFDKSKEGQIMARKAKRRGRPPGAKSPDKMDVVQLRQYIERLETVLRKRVGE
jgi:hypothetical protein